MTSNDSDSRDNDTSGADLRSLLSQVAAGSVAPDEASQRLAGAAPQAPDAADEGSPELGRSSPAGTPPIPPNPPAPPSSVRVVRPPSPPDGSVEGGPIQRVVIRAAAVKLVLVGDPTVVGASVEGPHVARRDGGALVIDTDAEPGAGDFSYESSTQRIGKAFGRWRGAETVVVKIRPELPVEVTVQAGSVMATRLEGGLRFTVEAGSLKAMDCSGEIDGRVEAGSAKLDWLLDRGTSRLRCELGSIKVRLDPRSNVTVQARAELGSVELGSTGSKGKRGPLVVGAGEATLDVKVELGSAKIGVGESTP